MTVFWRAETVPEKLVIDVTATVEFKGFGYFNGLSDIILCHCFRCLINQLIEVVDVGAVVFTVVEIHEVATDHRLERIQVVGEMFELDNARLGGSCSEVLA